MANKKINKIDRAKLIKFQFSEETVFFGLFLWKLWLFKVRAKNAANFLAANYILSTSIAYRARYI